MHKENRKELIRILSSWYRMDYLAEQIDSDLVDLYGLLCQGETKQEGEKAVTTAP